jgi:antitoxin component of MazEF toxin-antitoxin module
MWRMVLSTVRRSGNSIVVSIPREELEAAGVQIGDQVLVTIQPAEIQPGLRAELRQAVVAEIELSADAFARLADA